MVFGFGGEVLDVLVSVGGNFYGGIDRALCLGGDYSLAYCFWLQVTLDSGPFFCLSGAGARDNQLPGVSRIEWKCLYLFPFVYLSESKNLGI